METFDEASSFKISADLHKTIQYIVSGCSIDGVSCLECEPHTSYSTKMIGRARNRTWVLGTYNQNPK